MFAVVILVDSHSAVLLGLPAKGVLEYQLALSRGKVASEDSVSLFLVKHSSNCVMSDCVGD